MLDGQPRYDSYKDSGEIWLGQIPSDWNLECIRAVTELKSKRGEPDLPVLSVYRDYGVILKDSRDDNHNATSLDTTNYKVVAPGDLVVNKMKAWQGSMGVSQHEGIVSPAYITCKTDPDKIAPRFLHYTLRSQPFIAVYNSLSYGVRIGQWDMHYDDFKKIPLAYPDLDTQNRIVKFLDEKTAEIDVAVEKKRRLIDLLNEQKAILINRAVTKGLNPNAPMKDSGIDWIGEIPAHWEVKRLKNLVRDGTTVSYGIVQPGDHIEGGTPFIQTTNISKPRISLSDLQCTDPKIAKGYPRTSLEVGDLILGIRASVGAVHIVEEELKGVNLSRGIARIAVNAIVTPLFLRSFIQSKATEEFWTVASQGTTFTEISIANVKRLPVLVPPKDEQEQIAEFVRKVDDEVASTIAHVNTEITTLNEFKQTLIANAVTGMIKI